MKKILVTLALCISSMLSWAQTSYGDVKVDESKAVSISQLSKIANELREKNTTAAVNDVTISGEVDGVCQVKGCWMTVKLDDGEQMTIKFKDYAFFMPKDCSGRKFVAHGKLFIKTTSVAELRHLAEDAGKSKRAIRKIKKPKQEVRFEADGVTLA